MLTFKHLIIDIFIGLPPTEARARIEGPDNKEVHVKQRSRVKLTCVVDLGRGGESAAVFWYLDGQSLDWLGQTGPGRGVQVTEKRGTQLVSTLSIERADMHHAGKFTCSPSYAKPDTVTLHVIDSKFSHTLFLYSVTHGGARVLCVNSAYTILVHMNE